jgi:hypothetical protein
MKRSDKTMLVIGLISFFLGIICFVLCCVTFIVGVKKEIASGDLQARVKSGIEYITEHTGGIVIDDQNISISDLGSGITVSADGNNVQIDENGIHVQTVDDGSVNVDISGIDIDEDALQDTLDQVLG